MITVTFLNAAGEGMAETVQLSRGSSLGQLIEMKMPNYREGSYSIRLRRHENGVDNVYGKRSNPVTRGFTLQDGDRVTLSPVKPDMA